MANFENMVKMFYPDAIKDVDYSLNTDEETGAVEIENWNAEKLGPMPNVITLHTQYMKEIRKKKELIPTLDATDPAPWLNSPAEEKTRRMTERFHIPIVNVDPRTGLLLNQYE